MATKTAAKGSNGSVGKNRIVGESFLEVQGVNVAQVPFKLRGISPLVVHNFGAKTRGQILDKQMGVDKKAAREHRVPTREFLEAFYLIDGTLPEEKVVDNRPSYDKKEVAKFLRESTFGFPLSGFKQAMIAACRNADIKMVQARQSFFVSHPANKLLAIIKGQPFMDSSIVRLQNKTPQERFRPMWDEWETEIVVSFDRNKFSPDQVASLLATAGFYVGIGEGRPEKSALGWGRWELYN